MSVTRTFQNGNSVAVRLPKSFGMDAGVEVTVERFGNGVTVLPTSKEKSGAALVATLKALPRPDEPWPYEKAIVPARPGWTEADGE
ncbi:hypothetical protein BH09PSE2_BH09PSE2_04170 [soil metagenome]